MNEKDKVMQLSGIRQLQKGCEDHVVGLALEMIVQHPEEGLKHIGQIESLSESMGLYVILRMAFNHQREVMELMEDLPMADELDEYAVALWDLLKEWRMAQKAGTN